MNRNTSIIAKIPFKVRMLVVVLLPFIFPWQVYAAAVTNGVTTTSTSNAASYASAAFTPAAGDLLVVFVTSSGTVAAGTMTDSQGLGFTKITSVLKNTSADTVYMFVANNLAAASSMTVTFDCTGDNGTGAVINVMRISGMTAKGSSAVKQTKTAANQAAGGTPAATFSASALTGNPTLGVVGSASTTANQTPPTSWTEQSDAIYSTPSTHQETVSRDSGFTGTTITWGGTQATAFGVIIAEMDTTTLPTVTSDAADTVTATSANINGNITATGGTNATVRGFATSTNSTLSSSVSTSTASGSFGTGTFSAIFSNSALTGNTTYYFRSYATNVAGTGLGSILNLLTLPGTPTTPTYTSVTATSLTANWTLSGGAATYNLERCITSTNTCTLVTGISAVNQAVSSLTGNTSYDFAVQGVNATGNGAWSATSTQLTLPDTPGTVSLTNVAATSTTINWSAPTGGTTSYKLEYCVNGSSPCTLSTGLTVTSTTTNPSLTGNTTYGFAVRGTNATGDGVFTATTTQLTLPDIPGTPTFSGTTGTSTTISWTAPTGGAATYKVERCLISSCSYSEISSGGAGTSYDDTGTLSPGTAYRYRVRATNATGDGLYSSVADVTTESPPGTPGTPTFGTVTATTTATTWTASSPSATTYKLEVCSSPSSCSLFTGITSNATTTYSLTGNTSYDYAVRGLSLYGESAFSATSTQLTLSDVPGTVSITNIAATSTTINWSAPTGGTATYKLQYCVNGSTPCTLSTGLSVTSTTTNPSLTGNTTYGFAVRGTNATGDGLYTATTTQLTLPNIPGTPTFGSITETTLTVSWSAPTGGASTYKVARCTGSGCTDFSNIATGQVGTSYADSGLSSMTTYRYKILGTNATGDGLYSAIADVTTIDTTPPAPDPATFSSAPSPDSASQISMTATTQVDSSSSPTEYLFGYYACGIDGGTGGTSGAWQSGAGYSDSGLQPNQCYGYKTQGRDSASPPNKTASSTQSNTYTLANTPGAPTLSSPTASTLVIANAENSNPSSNPTTKFTASVTATSPTDSSWLGKYIDASGNPTATETWLSDAQLDNLTLNGLAGNTAYTFKVAARNESLVKTASSTATQATTTVAAPGTPTYSNVAATSTTVNWSAPAGGADTYKLERCTTGPSCTLVTGISGTSYNDTGLTGNTSYDYAVRGTTVEGDGSFSATSTQLTLPNIPGTPTFGSITETTLTVSWSAPTGGASTYKVARCTGSGCTDFSNIATGVATASYDDSALSAGTTYRYKILGTNATGDGLYSAIADVTTDATAATDTVRIIRIKGGTRLRGGIRLR